MKHYCLRVYPNGDWLREDRTPAELPEWLKHNEHWRFGCALFVDGKCRFAGYLTPAHVARVEALGMTLPDRDFSFFEPAAA